LLKGFIASDQDPVGVAGFPPANTGWGATPQSTLEALSCGRSQGPSTMYAARPARNAGSVCSDARPLGAVPSAKMLPYQVSAFTQASEAKSGVRFPLPDAPGEPPSCTASGSSW
jgi:hypothetical protein